MRVQLDVEGLSQYDNSIKSHYKPSACGPVTALTILRFWLQKDYEYDVNQLYRLLGGTRIGLFTWRLKKNLRKLLGPTWEINTCSLEDAKAELREGRPVACKFDRYFTFHWLRSYEFSYHWVPLIGYEENENGLTLLIHDNGGRNRESRIRYVSYKKNKAILTFVKIVPLSNTITDKEGFKDG
ncbi:MAG: C39 family peptidase [Paenisporosarcina sp.]